MVPPARVQFSLASLLTVIAILSALCASIAYGGLAGAWVGAPILLAAIAVLLGADARRLRQFCFALFACQALAFLLLAGMSYPIIVIADSDLGAGAMARVGDWLRLCGACLLGMVLIAASYFTTRMTIRLALTLVLLWWIVTLRFQSPVTPIAARLVLVAFVALLLAADALKTLSTRFSDCPSTLRSVVVMAVGGLLLLTDWQGRVYLGLLPSSYHSRDRLHEEAFSTSVSLMAGEAGQQAVSATGRLRARGNYAGSLLVENLDGGPSFHRPADSPDRVVSFVLFSPDGRTLAVGENHRQNHGSKVTLWSVLAGDAASPPKVTLEHVISGGGHMYWSASFFPDGTTLLLSNGDSTVSLWDVDSGREIVSYRAHAGQLADCVAASPDGRTFATWALNGLEVRDRSTLRLLHSMDTRQTIPISMAYGPDATIVIAADRDHVYYWKIDPSPIPILGLVLLSVGVVIWIGFSVTRS